MFIAHKIQLIPNKHQENAFSRAAGCARVAYNWALDEWKRQYKAGEKPSAFKLKKQFNAIKGEKFPWMYESPKDANQQPFKNLGKAYNAFFKNKSKRPKYKNKGKHNSFYISNEKFWINTKYIKIHNLGRVKMTEELRFSGKIMSCTISKRANKWYASINVEVPEIHKQRISDNVIALDFGLNTLAVDQNGNKIEAPMPFKEKQARLARYQRYYSRKQKGSNNRKKAQKKVAKLHKQIADKRNDFNHKLTTKLCRENQTIIMETLSLEGWKKKHGKSASDLSIGEIIRQINYKSHFYNNDIVSINKWLPTSKACSGCGCYKSDLLLSHRIYNCSDCGLSIDRDWNAAINIHRAGLAQINAFGH